MAVVVDGAVVFGALIKLKLIQRLRHSSSVFLEVSLAGGSGNPFPPRRQRVGGTALILGTNLGHNH